MTVETLSAESPSLEGAAQPDAAEPDWRKDHWASLPAYSSEFVSEVNERIRAYYHKLDKRGLVQRYHRAYAAYHGLSRTFAADPGATMQAQPVGLNDEFLEIEANHFRNLIKHSLNLATSGRPAFDVRALNNDHRSAAQVQIAQNAIDHYRREQQAEAILRSVAEKSLAYGEAFLHQYWDRDRVIETPNGNARGDVVHEALGPLDVPRQLAKDGRDQWRAVRDYMSRYDLAAGYPHLSDDLLRVSPPQDEWQRYRLGFDPDTDQDDSEIVVYYVYHARTPAVPVGRHAIIAGDVCLYDGPLPYDDLPVLRMAPSDFLDAAIGYADAWDLLGPQELYNAALSAIATRLSAFGVNNVAMEDGGSVGVDQLGGMNLILYPRGTRPPHPIELLTIPEELLKTLELTNQLMQTLSGINSVARGDPDANIKSGAAMALVQAMALQFNSGLQAAWVDLLERFGTGLVRILKRFAGEPRMIAIAGESGRWNMQQFVGDDLATIDRVFIDVGNPLARTTAGRSEIARDLLQAGLVKKPEEYFSVLTTGRLEPIYNAPTSLTEGIKAENEALGRGESVPVLQLDRHDCHIQEHLVLINTPESRADPRVQQATIAHVMQHLEQWLHLSMDAPFILAVTGTPPLPMPAKGLPQGPGPGKPQGADESSGPPPGAPGSGTPAQGGAGPDGGPPPPKGEKTPGGLPNMPNLPTNPMTGEKPDVPEPGNRPAY